MKSLKLLFTLVALLVAGVALAQPPAKAAGKTEVTWWGHAAFVLKSPQGAVIAIDPWLSNPKAPKDAQWPAQVDAILISHGHFDHVGDSVQLAKKTNAKVIGAFELVGQLGVGGQAVGMNIGGSIKVKDVTIHLVPAMHSSGFGQDPANPKYGGNPVGFVLQIDNGPTLYHAGDTGLFTDMAMIADVYHPSVAMLPIGGHFTMDPALAAIATKMLKVKTVVPMHFGTFPALAGTPAELTAAIKKEHGTAKVMELTPGKTQTF
jgi:L-ascorbate metabolism protein UlaG (beta-lactamase superfamily)